MDRLLKKIFPNFGLGNYALACCDPTICIFVFMNSLDLQYEKELKTHQYPYKWFRKQNDAGKYTNFIYRTSSWDTAFSENAIVAEARDWITTIFNTPPIDGTILEPQLSTDFTEMEALNPLLKQDSEKIFIFSNSLK